MYIAAAAAAASAGGGGGGGGGARACVRMCVYKLSSAVC